MSETVKNKKYPQKSMRQSRIEVVQVLYKFIILEREIDPAIAFEEFDFLNRTQLEKLEKIANNYEFIKKMIKINLSADWSFERLNPITKAILINATYELFVLDKAIVINEALEIGKMFFDTEDFQAKKNLKFINACLQSVFNALVILEKRNRKLENSDEEK